MPRTCGIHDSTLRLSKTKFRATPPWMRGVSPRNQGRLTGAFNSTSGSSDRCRRPAVAGQSLHSYARHYQINFEWSGRDCHGAMAAERIWTVSLAFRDPYRQRMKNREIPGNNASQISRRIYMADICQGENKNA